MGRNKALLPYRGGTLGEFVARTVHSAAGSAVLVGESGLYERFGYPVIPDLYPGEGPLGGILTALNHTTSEWNLVAACDMPGLSADFLAGILDAAVKSNADIVVPAGPSGRPEPLCAVYHRRARAGLEDAFRAGQRKVMAAVAGLRTEALRVIEGAAFQNVNTPEDWADHVTE